MNTLLNALSSSGVMGMLELLLCPLGGVLLLVVCGFLMRGHRVTPLVGAVALAAPMGLCMLGVWQGNSLTLQALASATPEARNSLMAAGISQVLSVRMLSGMVATGLAGVALLGCAIASVLQKPYSRVPSILVMLLTVVLSVLVLVEGFITAHLVSGVVRGGLFFLGGVLTSLALLSQDRPHVGALAAVAFPVLVAGATVFSAAYLNTALFEGLAYVALLDQGGVLSAWQAEQTLQRGFSVGAVSIGVLVSIIGTVRAREGSLRDVGTLCALLYGLCALLWVTMDDQITFQAFMTAILTSEPSP